MKNNRAFTLVELIVIIIIIGVIMVFALPNVTSTLEKNKKDEMIADAKDMIEKTKSYLLINRNEYPINDGDCKDFTLETIDSRKEIIESSFGNPYDRIISKVHVCLETNTYTYGVTLSDGTNKISNKYLSDLNGPSKYNFG